MHLPVVEHQSVCFRELSWRMMVKKWEETPWMAWSSSRPGCDCLFMSV